MRFIKAPIRALTKARDFYINSMTECAGRGSYGGAPMPYVSSLPKSFSVNSARSSNSDEDFRELVKVASRRSLGRKVELEILRQQSPLNNGGVNGVPRSQSVAIGRIDEDKACEFGEDVSVKVDGIYPRSRSYAVPKRSGMF